MSFQYRPYQEISLAGKKVLVTGASSGIGAASSFELAAMGCELFLVARRSALLEERAAQVKSLFPKTKIQCLSGDVRDEKFLQLLRDKKFFEVDVLINNAGLARGRDRIEAAKLEDWQEMLDTNVSAAFRVVHAALPHMISQKSGHIVNIGSIAGHSTYEGGSVYCASKFALTAFTKTLREEVCEHNVRVTLVSPGMVNTEFSLVRLRDSSAADKVYQGMEPLSAQDVAFQIAFCLRQPGHVNVDEIIVTPVAQGAPTKIVRKI